ncbi:3'(2'),5'-bisphosphate nucleotidase CysQ [Bacteroides cutis]|mgnify:FL=1|jgi:3'(2'), 5'-bisphosphate nucleotidase|uniref:3'(2'),5'-bisphosphate nucleotidase CysQ n=1 Tax=Bacteroides cutis TaxID=2024197 RepID=UPI000C795196|nr:3'(2'),5'-bisphosphate nucleotidase CysQ [Bacteroides cutis]
MGRQYILDAIDAALCAGKDIISIYDDPASDFKIEKKADNSPLTIADKKAHEAITKILQHTPYPVLSEEGKHLPFVERHEWETLWIVDPLDGTKEFIKRNGEFTVNIALVHDSVPVMGVIYLPVKKELYFADEEIGAYKLSGITMRAETTLDELMASAVRLPDKDEHDKFVIVASRSHLSPETEVYIEEMKRHHPDVELISSGSSIKICLVAEGKADVYPRFAPTMEWDTAAGHAIARAAGMEIYQVGKEEPLQYNKEDLLNPWFVVEPRRVKTKKRSV